MIALLAIATTCPFVQGGDNSGYLVPATAAGTSMVGPAAVFCDQSSITQRELARRKERTRQAMILLEEGRQAYRDKKYKLALDKYNEALSTLPNAPATEPQRKFIIDSIGDASVATAIEYSRIGRYDEAEQLLLDTLRNNPDNKRARQELSMLRDPVRNNPALTPEHVKNVEEVSRLLTLAYGYYNLGQFTQAYDEFNRVLLIDPYNEAARRGQEAVSRRQLKYYETAHDTFRARALAEVEAMWEPKVPVNAPQIATITEETTQISAQQTENVDKLNSLHINSVNFEDTSIEDALDFLRGEFRKAGQSVNFIFERPVVAQPAVVASSSEDEDSEEDGEAEASAPTPAPVAAPRESNIAKLELRDVTAKVLLDMMTAQAGCQYRIDDNAIVVYPSGAGNEKMFRRQYKVTREFFAGGDEGEDSSDSMGDDFLDAGSAPKRSSRINAKAALSSMGVAFPKGATANYSSATGLLTVYNTLDNLDFVEEAVAEKRRSLPQMIKVATKFVEVSQTNTDELSFDWVINPFSISNGGNTFLGGGSNANPNNMIGEPQNYNGLNRWPNGIGQVTDGLRTGNGAVTGSTLDQLLTSGSTTNASTTTPAPGILSLTGIYNDGAYQMIMRGLSQKKGVDIMSAPSLLARPGEMAWTPQALPDQDEDDNCAKIAVVRRFIYPTAFDPPELSNSNNNGNNNNNNNNNGWGNTNLPVATPANPSEWATEEVGIVLRFRVAEGEGDSDVIKFEHFEIKVVDFEGFVNYGSPIMAGIPTQNGGDGGVKEVQLTENRIDMPIFQRRFINSNPCIYDGHTIAIGGLISENVQKVEDKVPVFGDLPLVGRFFRSNVESHIKKNLMVFVTAEKVDPTGRPTRERETGTPATASSAPSLFPDEGLAPQP